MNPRSFEMKTQKEVKASDQRTNYYWKRVRKHGDQYKNSNWPLTELVLSLVYTHDVFRSYFQRALAKFDLSISAMNILAILKHDEGGGCTQQELSSLLLVSRANITKVIDGLEKRGIVTRNASKEDRRTRVIKLTLEGGALADKVIPNQNDCVARITAGLANREIHLLSKLLAKFRTSIIESEK